MPINEHVSLYERKVNLKCFRVSCQSRNEIGGGDGHQTASSFYSPICILMGQRVLPKGIDLLSSAWAKYIVPA